MQITLQEKKTIDITPNLLAQIFWELDHNQQADFFDCLARISEGNLETQMQNVALFSDNLTRAALMAMVSIGKDATERAKDE